MEQIIVGMSGGVDSTVAVHLLKKAGYAVHGVMLRFWKAGGEVTDAEIYQENLAREAAVKMGIQFSVLDVRRQFRELVVNYFIRSYESGITPNPCFFCNRMMKFETLIDFANTLNVKWVSSGHYAKVIQEKDQVSLQRGADPLKDQSYMLASLRNDQLKRLILPLGEFTKGQVREIASQMKFKANESQESQDVCFLPEGDYAEFLQEVDADVNHLGDIINSQGEVIGEHRGLAFYTIGQRKGLGIYSPEPTYVLEKKLSTNQLVVGGKNELGCSTMMVSDVYWHKLQQSFPFTCSVEIRYHSKPAVGEIRQVSDSQVQVEFSTPMRDITPGQAAVFYDGNEVTGSGIIAVNR